MNNQREVELVANASGTIFRITNDRNGQVELVANEKGVGASPWYSKPSCGL